MLPYLPSIEAGALEDYVKSIYPTISISDRKLEPIVQTNGSIQHVFIIKCITRNDLKHFHLNQFDARHIHSETELTACRNSIYFVMKPFKELKCKN